MTVFAKLLGGALGVLAVGITLWWTSGSTSRASESSEDSDSEPAVATPNANNQQPRKTALLGSREPPEEVSADPLDEQEIPSSEPHEAWELEASSKRNNSNLGLYVREAIDFALPDGSDVVGVTCRSTVCRAEVHLTDRDAVMSFQHELLMGEQNWEGRMSFRKRGAARDDRLIFDCYFAAAGDASDEVAAESDVAE